MIKRHGRILAIELAPEKRKNDRYVRAETFILTFILSFCSPFILSGRHVAPPVVPIGFNRKPLKQGYLVSKKTVISNHQIQKKHVGD
jgi:hypothetical protein